MARPDDHASEVHRRYMLRALKLAKTQLGLTAENPSVGCLIVRDGAVVGQGVTGDGGRPHGEAGALQMAGEHAAGADVYVTLEPCAHFGQTPPCADSLIAAKVGRVFIACIDPDPRVHWQGAARLQEAGIDVQIGLCCKEAQIINADFFARVRPN